TQRRAGHAGSPAGGITGRRPGGAHRVAQPGGAGAGGGGSHPPGGGQAAQPLTAFCGLQPLFKLPLRGSFLRAAPAGTAAVGGLMRGSAPTPQCKGRYPLANPSGPRSSWFLVYQTQLSIRGQGASMPLPARLESSKRCYWLWQTSGWNEWAEKTVATTPAWLYWARYARKTKNQKPKTKN